MNNTGPIPQIPNGTVNSSGQGVSSLVTDANSCLSGGPHMQRSTSINADSYMRLPASPMSFSSNNISNSSVIDGSSIIHPNHPHEEHMQKRRASSSVTSQPLPPNKKSRADISMRHQQASDLFLQQQAMQQQQQQFHQNPQLQAMLQQHRLQGLQGMGLQGMGRGRAVMQHAVPQAALPQGIQVKSQGDGGLCFRRLMQYLYHKRQRPADNSISYWRKLVDEYFAPKARKRWCVSLYDNRGSNGFNSFQHNNLDAWRCEICGTKSGKGFEAPAEILPRLCQIKFDRGVLDEHLFLDMPHEYRLNSGIMVLEYGKAVQESVYEHARVIHEGRLRIIFTPELKIISWEFCAKRHEEFVPRRFVAPQVNQLLQVAQKYQAAVSEGGSNGVSAQDTQTICNMFVTAGRQMAKNLEIQLLNEHGFSKRYVRCLQISEVVNSMKDLIDFSQKNKTGPIDGLKSYTSQNLQNLQSQNISPDNNNNNNNNNNYNPNPNNNQFMTVTTTDHPSSSKTPSLHPEITNLPLPSNAPRQNSTIALTNYQNMLKSSIFNTGLPNSLTGMNMSMIQQPGSNMQQHVIQQLLQEVKNNSRPVNSGGGIEQRSVPSNNNAAHVMNRSSSFKSVGSNPNNAGTSNNNNNNVVSVKNEMDLPELDQIGQEFDSSIFDWKM